MMEIKKGINNDAILEESTDSLRCVPANSLPEGWFWNGWDDGSGCLKSPIGERYFSYDLTTVEGGVEYKVSSTYSWNAFFGSFTGFKEFAESYVKDNIIKK